MPSEVPQSSSMTMTSCATSTSRRVRYPESAVFSAVSARPLRAPCVEMKYCSTERPSRKFAVIGVSMTSPEGLDIKPAHPGELANLLLGPAGAGVRHDVDRVELAADLVGLLHLLEHLVGDVLGRPVPDVDDLVVPLTGRDDAGVALRVHLQDLPVGGLQEFLLLRRDHHVVHADRDAGPGRGREAEVLQVVEHQDGHLLAEGQVHVADEVGQTLLLQVAVDEGDDVPQRAVEEDAADGRVDQGPLDVLDLGVDDVLVVVLRRQVDVLARNSARGSACASRPPPARRRASPRRSRRRCAPPPSCSSGTWSGSRSPAPGPARGRPAAAPKRERGCCWRRASASPPRSGPWATAARGRPSGRRRSRR